jgi:hypothetical protein
MMLASLSRESKEGREREREREREKRGRKRWGHRLVFYDNYECKNKEVFVSFLEDVWECGSGCFSNSFSCRNTCQ